MKQIVIFKKKAYTFQSEAQENWFLLLLCVILSGLLCFTQIQGNNLLILLCLLGCLLLLAGACRQDKALPVLLYFLPWSPLMRLNPESISFFTIGLLLVCVISLIRNGLSFDLYQLVLTAALAALTLAAKLIQGNSIENSYLCFLVMLLLFPCVIRGQGQHLHFLELTVYFAFGIIVAALSAQQVANYPRISAYITVNSYATITRLSGYYGDPNFYAAQITACLAGMLLLLEREAKLFRRLLLGLLSMLLLYCGLLSASKSFIIITACLFLVWVPMLMKRSRHGAHLRLLAGGLCAALILLSFSGVQELLRIMDTRFSYSANVSQLTTGRTDLWHGYLEELSRNIPLLLLGQGYSKTRLDMGASHNTILQGIYQFGLVGFPLLWAWMYSALKKIFPASAQVHLRGAPLLLLCIGVVLPWMALDILFFDELFLLPAYVLVGSTYTITQETSPR